MSRAFGHNETDKLTLSSNLGLAGIQNTNQFTIVFWMFLNATATSIQTIFNFGTSTTLSLRLLATNVFRMTTTPNGSGATTTATTGPTASVWSHVAVTFNLNTDKINHIYVNGVELAYSGNTKTTDTFFSGLQYWPGIILNIGTVTALNGLDGNIAELAVFNRALNIAEINAIYNSVVGISPNGPGWDNLVGYWHLSGQPTASPEPDSYSNNSMVVTGTTLGPDYPGYAFVAAQPATQATSISQSGISNPGISPATPNSGAAIAATTVGVPEAIGRFDINTVVNNPA